MKPELSRRRSRMTNMLSKIFGISFAALLLSSVGTGQVQATDCRKCNYHPPPYPGLPGGWTCSLMWWFENGGGHSCVIEGQNCRVVIPPGWTCS